MPLGMMRTSRSGASSKVWVEVRCCMVVKASMGGMGQHFGDVETGEVDSVIMVN